MRSYICTVISDACLIQLQNLNLAVASSSLSGCAIDKMVASTAVHSLLQSLVVRQDKRGRSCKSFKQNGVSRGSGDAIDGPYLLRREEINRSRCFRRPYVAKLTGRKWNQPRWTCCNYAG